MVEPKDMSCYAYYKACTDEYGEYYCQQHLGKKFLNTRINSDIDALAGFFRIELGLKPGDVYYRPEFDAVSGRFVSKECVFNGSADEFTIIIERKTGFKTRERCDALVEFYNNSLSTAFAQDSAAGELFEHNME